MADIHSQEVRSYNMSRIRSKDTGPEMQVRRALYSNGFRYRLHSSFLPGKPDIILKRYNIVIFINGCFLHGHDNCKYYKLPATRTEWWDAKIKRTKERDAESIASLTKARWKVVVIFECELKRGKADATISKLLGEIK